MAGCKFEAQTCPAEVPQLTFADAGEGQPPPSQRHVLRGSAPAKKATVVG